MAHPEEYILAQMIWVIHKNIIKILVRLVKAGISKSLLTSIFIEAKRHNWASSNKTLTLPKWLMVLYWFLFLHLLRPLEVMGCQGPTTQQWADGGGQAPLSPLLSNNHMKPATALETKSCGWVVLPHVAHQNLTIWK